MMEINFQVMNPETCENTIQNILIKDVTEHGNPKRGDYRAYVHDSIDKTTYIIEIKNYNVVRGNEWHLLNKIIKKYLKKKKKEGV